MDAHVYKFTAGMDDDGRRVDRIVRKLCPDIPLSAIYKLLRNGSITVNGKKCKQNEKIKDKDSIEIILREKGALFNTFKNINTQNADLFVINNHTVYENNDIIIINKPRGVETHGQNSIAEFASLALKNNDSLSFVPAPLHRLDKNTSGLLIISKSIDGARKISAAIRNHQLEKHYLAVLEGVIEEAQVWTDYLVRDPVSKITHIVPKTETNSAKQGILKLAPLFHSENFTLADITLVTGLTHQIRAQCSHYGFPLAGDKKYGSKIKVPHYFLHAWEIKNMDTIFCESPPVITAVPDALQSAFIEKYFHIELKHLDALVAFLQ